MWSMVLIGASQGILPEETAGRVVFVVIGLVIVGLYFLLRRTQKRSADAYWERRKRERELRENDPDMRTDDG